MSEGPPPGAFLVFAVLLGLIPAVIASRKGGSFLGWWVFGTVLWIVALPLALMLKGRQCAFCRSGIANDATVCPRCQREQPAENPPEPPSMPLRLSG